MFGDFEALTTYSTEGAGELAIVRIKSHVLTRPLEQLEVELVSGPCGDHGDHDACPGFAVPWEGVPCRCICHAVTLTAGSSS